MTSVPSDMQVQLSRQAKQAAGSLAKSAESTPTTEQVQDQAKEAVSSVADSAPTPAGYCLLRNKPGSV